MGMDDIAVSERAKTVIYFGKRRMYRRWTSEVLTPDGAMPELLWPSDELLADMVRSTGEVYLTVDVAEPNGWGADGASGWPWSEENDTANEWTVLDAEWFDDATTLDGIKTAHALRRALESKTMRAPTSAALPVTAALVEALGGPEATDAAAMANGYPGIIIYGASKPDTCGKPGCNAEYDADVVCGDEKWRVCEEHCAWIPENLSADIKARSETHETT